MIITNCKVNHLTNPLGYTLERTVFSWTAEQAVGKRQTAARIIVRQGETAVADTGWAKMDSLAATVDVELLPRTWYTWTVSVRTDAGEEAVSGKNWLDTGKMDELWAGEWIGCDDGEVRHPVFSKKIVPTKNVASARLYICGLGLYEAAWNGQKIGGECLTPYCNNYHTWVQYQTYDITEQLKNGGVLSITLGNGWYKGRFGHSDRDGKPYYLGYSAAWGDAACGIPWTVYQFSGDRTVLEEHFESMCGWVDFIQRLDGDDHSWRRQVHYGDWLALDTSDPEERRGGTEVGYVANAMYYRCARLTAQAAKTLGRGNDAKHYSALADHILQEIRHEYFTPNGRCAIPTQTGLTLAVAFGLGPDSARSCQALVQKLEADEHRLKTGFVVTPLLCPTLTAVGRDDIAFELLLNEDYPGWLYAVKLGATTVWERWNSLLPDGSISGTGMNSLNYYAYGSILEWMFRDVAGLSPLTPGFRRAKLAPHVRIELGQVSLTYRSAAGEWQSAWEVLDNRKVLYTCKVPFGCTAELHLPGGCLYELGAGVHVYEEVYHGH